jgi:hypothetical protein
VPPFFYEFHSSLPSRKGTNTFYSKQLQDYDGRMLTPFLRLRNEASLPHCTNAPAIHDSPKQSGFRKNRRMKETYVVCEERNRRLPAFLRSGLSGSAPGPAPGAAAPGHYRHHRADERTCSAWLAYLVRF